MTVSVIETKSIRWRLFRHDAGRAAGPPAWAYIVLFALCQLVGIWMARTFAVTIMWPANAVLLAAVLQLHRPQAVVALAACFAINLASNAVRGDPGLFLWGNALFNIIQVMVAAVLVRRFCGAALDMRRPMRLLRFAIALAPAVAISTALAAMMVLAAHNLPLGGLSFRLRYLFEMEALAMLIVTPSLLLLARQHRFAADSLARWPEVAALAGLVVLATAAIFFQNQAPVLFMIFPPLILLAFRLSPPWTAGTVVLIAVVGGAATLLGHGPITLTRLTPDAALAGVPDTMRQMSVFHLFLLAVVGTALPITTLSTERRRLVERLKARTEAALSARQRAEAAYAVKGRFLAMMSHEMRTPLTGITGYADLLSRRPCMDDEGLRQVDAVRHCGETMLRLVEDLLEVSRGGAEVTPKANDVRQMMEEAIAPSREWAAIKGLAFALTLAPEAEGQAMIDARRLRQSVHHLVNNAVKFTGRGGVTVAVDRIEDRLSIVVSDTGCGMDEQTRAGVFGLFEQGDATTTRAHEGAGVGLALAKNHIACLGGAVMVESRQWGGSTFTLTIPAPVVEAVEGEESVPLHSRRTRILIVDDHPANRDLLRIMLQAADCETAEAADGEQALAVLAVQPFDLVLMDVRMPVMDGIAATRAIRALDTPLRDVPVLAVTAEAMPEDAARCIAAGMDGHLAKPVTQAKLYAAIEAVFDTVAERTDAVCAA
jgi:two-component system, sensor histidine kinase